MKKDDSSLAPSLLLSLSLLTLTLTSTYSRMLGVGQLGYAIHFRRERVRASLTLIDNGNWDCAAR